MSDSKFIAVIDVENDAFFEQPSAEVSRILRELADKVDRGCQEMTLRDYNGNKVGDAGFIEN